MTPDVPGMLRSDDMAALRIYIAEDHPVFRRGLVESVAARPSLELVGEGATARDATQAVLDLVPDVALLDVRLPDGNGMDVLKRVNEQDLATRVVFLSAHEERSIVYDALANGAAGFLSKSADRDEILDAVEAAGRGENVLSPSIQTLVATEIRRREQANRALLSPREMDVLRLVADGHTAPDIGRQLHLGTTTVKAHLQSIYEKLEVGDRAAAVAVAMRLGLLE